MIYTAIISVCLIAAPNDCRVYEQPLTELSANPSVAYVEAQALVAKWLQHRPRFKLQGFKLEPGRGA